MSDNLGKMEDIVILAMIGIGGYFIYSKFFGSSSGSANSGGGVNYASGYQTNKAFQQHYAGVTGPNYGVNSQGSGNYAVNNSGNYKPAYGNPVTPGGNVLQPFTNYSWQNQTTPFGK